MMLAKSLQSAAGNAAEANYIEDVFSTYLYTGNGSTQTITNGIDLAGKGGLVWTKVRNNSGQFHWLFDTARGASKALASNATNAQWVPSGADGLTAFNSSGFSIDNDYYGMNTVGENGVSWTFRKQPKFFDVVTYTGNGSAPRAISHSLGSTPGCIMIKATSTTGNWWVFHRSAPNQGAAYQGIGGNLYLDATDAADTGTNPFLSAVSSTTFTLSTNQNTVMNASGVTYVAYLFAHNAGGFGLTGTDNVISCGSFTGNGSSGQQITLGYEPQFIIIKQTNASDTWRMYDNMRGMGVGGSSATLQPNDSNNESTDSYPYINATGFTTGAITSGTFIYIAIRRGPMKTPTTGTSVFAPVAQNSAGTVTTNFPVDLMIGAPRASLHDTNAIDRLRGSSTTSFAQLRTNRDSAEATGTGNGIGLANNTGFVDNFYSAGVAIAYWNFRRAPGFFDEVCYTGTGVSGQTFAHNLGVAPELIIGKRRNALSEFGWPVYNPVAENLCLNSNLYQGIIFGADIRDPTSTTFATSAFADINEAGGTYVAYLFASCPGVSKVTNFTGNGTSQTINCGFTSGARFVMIKATSTTGNWTVFDSARGISAGGDPALYLNSTAAEVTGVDAIDADSTGFIVNQEGTFNLNASGVQYLVLAIS